MGRIELGELPAIGSGKENRTESSGVREIRLAFCLVRRMSLASAYARSVRGDQELMIASEICKHGEAVEPAAGHHAAGVGPVLVKYAECHGVPLRVVTDTIAGTLAGGRVPGEGLGR